MGSKARTRTTTRSSSTRKATTGRGGKISFHRPGEMPEEVMIKAGTTLDDFSEVRNLAGFDVFVNGNKCGGSTMLQKGDIVRVGVKTKNG